jgi:hypothetical protein
MPMNPDLISNLADAVIRNLPDGILERRKILEALCDALPHENSSRQGAMALLGLLKSHEAAQLKFSFPPKPNANPNPAGPSDGSGNGNGSDNGNDNNNPSQNDGRPKGDPKR